MPIQRKARLQWAQWKGFSPVWMRWWVRRLSLREYVLLQTPQTREVGGPRLRPRGLRTPAFGGSRLGVSAVDGAAVETATAREGERIGGTGIAP